MNIKGYSVLFRSKDQVDKDILNTQFLNTLQFVYKANQNLQIDQNPKPSLSLEAFIAINTLSFTIEINPLPEIELITTISRPAIYIEL